MTAKTCDRLARELAADIALELDVPFYLYAHSAGSEERRELSAIRRGGYEGLRVKLSEDAWIPDFGPRRFVPRWGATACGARDFLIAWNVNLSSPDVSTAKAVAARLRATSPEGKKRFPGLKAIGWYMQEYGCAQVSCNVYDFRAAPLAAVYREIDALAREFGARARGSELIGLVPMEAILEAGLSFTGADPHRADRDELIAAAVEGLGLGSRKPFEPEERILELALAARGMNPGG